MSGTGVRKMVSNPSDKFLSELAEASESEIEGILEKSARDSCHYSAKQVSLGSLFRTLLHLLLHRLVLTDRFANSGSLISKIQKR